MVRRPPRPPAGGPGRPGAYFEFRHLRLQSHLAHGGTPVGTPADFPPRPREAPAGPVRESGDRPC
ncbi:hypothetical protein ACIQVL_23555 [Streptomyces sp. NPDC090499]|uniref:hypothetical protein n=1 Tax=Streptomyces sp. NPDC090499 TaxID=3365965 RepID=UPI00382BDF88